MPFPPAPIDRFNDDDWYIWNADTKLIVRIVGCRSPEVFAGRMPEIEVGQAMGRGMRAKFLGLSFGDEGKSIYDLMGELGGLVAEAKTLGGPAAMTAKEYASAASNALPAAFVEKERRSVWRRKQDAELAADLAAMKARQAAVAGAVGQV